MIQKKLILQNKLGLHARAAAKFIALAGRFASEIKLTYNNKTADAKSILGVMGLAATYGSEIELVVIGEDEVEALAALEGMVNDKFGEKN